MMLLVQYNCKSDGPSVSWTGCASSTDPNRFVLHVNVTCPDWTKRNVTVTLRADVLKSSTGALSVIDVDDEAVGGRTFHVHFIFGCTVLQSSCSCSWSAQLHGRGVRSLRRGCLHVTHHGGALPVCLPAQLYRHARTTSAACATCPGPAAHCLALGRRATPACRCLWTASLWGPMWKTS